MSPLAPRYKSGETVGGWTVLELIGVGRNGEVWRVDEANPKALKILRASNPQAEQYLRFRDEVAILRRLADRPGILPLIDASVPERPSRNNPAWILTPLAVPIREALSDGTLEEVVRAHQEIARTLTDLHAEGIFHRDIKPDNMFALEDAFVIGDFGLVTYPEKQDVTQLRQDQRHPGPLYYLAPELLGSGPVDPAPADVYALAKTMWVLATGQSYPPPGPLDIASASARLSSFAQHRRAVILDRLLERET